MREAHVRRTSEDDALDGAVEPTVVIADDHPAILDAVSRFLEHNGFVVVGTATDGESAVSVCERLRPDVAVVDLRMPVLSGLGVLEKLRRRVPDTHVVVYTGVGDPEIVLSALEVGAVGVVPKDTSMAELLRAIRLAARGSRYIDPTLVSFMFSHGMPAAAGLTPREIEVLQLLANGLNNESIGSELHISPDTVRSHIRKAMVKLRATTRTEAVATAFRKALIS